MAGYGSSKGGVWAAAVTPTAAVALAALLSACPSASPRIPPPPPWVPPVTHLVDELPEEFARLKDELYRWWRPNQFDVLVDPAASGAEGEMSEETSEQLKALGYLE